MNRVFTKDHTLNAKGIAIIMMCVHHLFSYNSFLTLPTKVCVDLFTILSGYGINESYKKQECTDREFVWNHIKKLMINYWYVFIPMLIVSIFFYIIPKGPVVIYGTGIKGVTNFLLDFLGIRASVYTPSLNNTWWYMEAILFCYILFPIIRKGIRKKTILTFVIILIPNIVAIFNEKILITTDREIFYILPFAIGVFFSEKGILNKLVKFSIENKYKYIIIAIPILILNLMFATKIKLIGNIFYAVSVISVSIWLLTNFKSICEILKLLGKHSMNIFLSHSFFYFYLIPGRKLMNMCRFPIVKLIVLISVSVIFSICVEYIKNIINNYNRKEENKGLKGKDKNKELLKEKITI